LTENHTPCPYPGVIRQERLESALRKPESGWPGVQVWTDGSTMPTNPGRGGWACYLRTMRSSGEVVEKEMSGSSWHSTNIRMELTAFLRALRALQAPSNVAVYTDSQYVIDGYSNIKNKSKILQSHQDLWGEILTLSVFHNVAILKVKAHSGVENNERVDQLAKLACQGQVGDPYATALDIAVEYWYTHSNGRIKR